MGVRKFAAASSGRHVGLVVHAALCASVFSSRSATAQPLARPPAAPAAAAPATATPTAPRAAPHPFTAQQFSVDPVTDGAILSVGFGFAGLLELIISTGELTPQQPGSTDTLLSIDRDVVEEDPSAAAATISNLGVAAAGLYVLGDVVETSLRRPGKTALVDGFIYAETFALTWTATNLVKISVRRPRPSAYRLRDEQIAAGGQPDLSGTDNALSFFSGHAAVTAALASTATYLAFAREDSPTRGYITLAGGTIVTGVVSWGRVKGGKHFGTDVIAGAMAGVGVGLLVPHLHREEKDATPIWIGLGPAGDEGNGLSLSGAF